MLHCSRQPKFWCNRRPSLNTITFIWRVQKSVGNATKFTSSDAERKKWQKRKILGLYICVLSIGGSLTSICVSNKKKTTLVYHGTFPTAAMKGLLPVFMVFAVLVICSSRPQGSEGNTARRRIQCWKNQFVQRCSTLILMSHTEVRFLVCVFRRSHHDWI